MRRIVGADGEAVELRLRGEDGVYRVYAAPAVSSEKAGDVSDEEADPGMS